MSNYLFGEKSNKEKLHQVHKKKEDSFIAVVPEPGQCQTESIIAVEVSFFKKPKLCSCKNKFMKKMNKEFFLQFTSVNS